MAAEGTADELKATVGSDRIEVVVRDAAQLPDAVRVLGLPGVVVDRDRRLLSAPAADRMGVLVDVVRELWAAGIEAEDIAVRRPTLDEVFLSLTEGGPLAEGESLTGCERGWRCECCRMGGGRFLDHDPA